MRELIALALGVLLSGSLAACTAVEVVGDEGRQVVVITTPSVQRGGAEAAVEGVLTWGAGGCLSISPEAGVSYLLLMPAGTTVSGDELSIGGRALADVGTKVTWSGGFGRAYDRTTGDLSGLLASAPKDCITEEVATVTAAN